MVDSLGIQIKKEDLMEEEDEFSSTFNLQTKSSSIGYGEEKVTDSNQSNHYNFKARGSLSKPGMSIKTKQTMDMKLVSKKQIEN